MGKEAEILRIRKLRERAGLSQAQLADRLDMDPSTVSKWESEDIKPRADVLPRLAALLNCSIDELFGWDRPGT